MSLMDTTQHVLANGLRENNPVLSPLPRSDLLVLWPASFWPTCVNMVDHFLQHRGLCRFLCNSLRHHIKCWELSCHHVDMCFNIFCCEAWLRAAAWYWCPGNPNPGIDRASARTMYLPLGRLTQNHSAGASSSCHLSFFLMIETSGLWSVSAANVGKQ